MEERFEMIDLEEVKLECICQEKFIKVRNFFRHFIDLHSDRFDFFECGLDECKTTFSNIVNFKRHIYRQHSISDLKASQLENLIKSSSFFSQFFQSIRKNQLDNNFTSYEGNFSISPVQSP